MLPAVIAALVKSIVFGAQTAAGLVMSNKSGNYVAVMPVPLRRKYGIWVVHQPLFCQFLGVFGAKLTPDLEDDFARALLKHYWYGSIFYLRLPEKNSPFQ